MFRRSLDLPELLGLLSILLTATLLAIVVSISIGFRPTILLMVIPILVASAFVLGWIRVLRRIFDD